MFWFSLEKWERMLCKEHTGLWYQDGATHKRKRGYRWRAAIGGEAPADRSNWAPRDFTPSTGAMRSAFQYR